jgi:hypothetical protein
VLNGTATPPPCLHTGSMDAQESDPSLVPCPICPAGPLTEGTRTRDMLILVCFSCGTSLSVPLSHATLLRWQTIVNPLSLGRRSD